jgi:GTP cyclohydrolase I
MRGVQKRGAMTSTSSMSGLFQKDQNLKKEFFDLIKN